MEPKYSSYEESVEYLTYDIGDMVGDVGGYLGLFLGWSILSMIGAIPPFLNKLASKLFPGKQMKQKDKMKSWIFEI